MNKKIKTGYIAQIASVGLMSVGVLLFSLALCKPSNSPQLLIVRPTALAGSEATGSQPTSYLQMPNYIIQRRATPDKNPYYVRPAIDGLNRQSSGKEVDQLSPPGALGAIFTIPARRSPRRNHQVMV